MLDAGTYKAKAVAADVGYTSNGKEQIAVDFEIMEGEESGQRITWYGYFTDKAQKRTMDSLATAGIVDLANLDAVAENKTLPAVDIVVEHEEYEGKIHAKVKWINSGRSVLKKPMDAAQKADFAARMKAKASEEDIGF